MPTSLFQYEMLPTTWFYLSTLLILALFFRFNRILSVRNLDVIMFIMLTPGLVYVAMGSALQGYVWLFVVGTFIFARLAVDPFFRRRPILAPNLNYSGLIFSCVASSAFMIPNLFLNRGDACESPRAWRLEQILACADEANPDVSATRNWPGYPPFLQATADVNRFFAPSQTAWRRAVAEALTRKQDASGVDFFGFSIRDDSSNKKRSAARAVRWASGAAEEYSYNFDESEYDDDAEGRSARASYPHSLNGVRAAPIVPSAPVAPNLSGVGPERDVSDASIASTPTSGADPDFFSGVDGGSDFEDGERMSMSDSAMFRWQPLSQEGLIIVLCVIFLQIALLAVMVLIGHVHFGSLQTGFAAALLYLLLPYINQFSARLDHIVPALLILMAVLLYTRPFLSGLSLAAAGMLVFYPFLLAPLWAAYYWKKGLGRFIVGSTASVLTLAVLLLFVKNPELSYTSALESTFGNHSVLLRCADGIWEYLPRFYRIPIIALYGVFCFGYALFIPQKNLATLMAFTAALMLGVQFWMGRQGGLYMAWFLPLAILTIFRPNLADRTATASVVDL
ncbi:MAG: hypothetical protein ACOX0A_01425 [Thermoguttaceae bacterium]|jgi:hypothetical protein